MSSSATYSFARYLAAKKSIDDRCLNQHVWQRLVEALPPATPDHPLRVLEVGAGIGTMIERLLEKRVLSQATYTAIDAESANVTEACCRLRHWASEHGFRVTQSEQCHPPSLDCRQQLRLQHSSQDTQQDILVELEAIDVSAFVRREQGQQVWDVLIAHAFLDLIDVPATLPGLFSVLSPGGLLYCTLTFDGATIFQPQIDPGLDAQIEAVYHQTMDQRLIAGTSSGESRAGRHLFGHFRAAGAEVLAAGSSDWVVFAGSNGYPADEAYFLHCILHTIQTALTGHPDLDAKHFAGWLAQRHAQVEHGSLVYIAHQLDLLGRVPIGKGGNCF
jgi:hypothetical protein